MVKVPTGLGSSLGSGIFKVFGVLLGTIRKYFFWISFILAIVILFSTSISESVEQKSVKPLITGIGYSLMTGDAILYDDTTKFINNDYKLILRESHEENVIYNWWINMKETVKFYSRIFSALWLIVVTYIILYKLFKTHDESATFWNLLFALIFYTLLMVLSNVAYSFDQSIMTSYSETPPSIEEQYDKFESSFIPFRGLRLFMRTIIKEYPKYFNPQKVINQELNVTNAI